MGIRKAPKKILVTLCAGLVTKIFCHMGMLLRACSAILQYMRPGDVLKDVVVRNLLGLCALLVLHFLVDFISMQSREGSSKLIPYVFVATMYGWIVFHNRVLFDKLFLQRRRIAYFAWTGLAMLLFSLNMY